MRSWLKAPMMSPKGFVVRAAAIALIYLALSLAGFRDQLQILGAPVVRRYSGGKDIGAACGTLEASSYGGTLIPPPARFPSATSTG